MSDESWAGFFGRGVMRLEDHKLLRGAGHFIDDIALPGVLHAAFVRSPIAHGLLRGSTAARIVTGVHAVLAHADLVIRDLPATPARLRGLIEAAESRA
jgi:aerobic carbon-monoxide dehydrogenase large subunit